MADANSISVTWPAYADLPVFDGKRLRQINPHALAAWGIKHGISGMSNENGLQANVAAYASHIEKIGKAAADAAIADWIDQHPKED